MSKNEKVKIAREVYRRLKNLDLRRGSRYTSKVVEPYKDLYKMLIATILSQNTNDKNSIKAYSNLEKDIGVDITNIDKASEEDIAKSISIAGLYNIKARKIKRLTKVIKEKFGGDLRNIIKMETNKARETLLELPGVGFKTADILLLFTGKEAFPVDTHITRITKRLGLVDEEAGYEEISSLWMKSLNPSDYKDAHLQLIAFGRKICIARKPRCRICPLNDICNFYQSGKYG